MPEAGESNDPPSQPATGAAGPDPVATQLRPLLQRQLARLRSRYLLFGVGKALLWVAALVLLFFVLDRWLRLPTPIRLLHTLATVGVGAYALVHFVRYPLSRRFSEVDLAQWLEHTYPDLHQRLVSAVQLHGVPDAGLRNQSRAMIDALWRETAERAGTLRLDSLFDNRALRRVLAGALALLLVLVSGAMLAPQSARVFALRHVGVDVDYPRDTTLVVELPAASPDLQREDDGATTTLVLPAGADLHVSVLAQGVVPEEVFLELQPIRDDERSGSDAAGSDTGVELPSRSVPMTPRPGDRFRYVFRRLSGSFRFHARGGDDPRGDRTVIVRTVRPAQVSTLTAVITPPAYTGVERIEQNGGGVEALDGSAVELSLRATAPVRKATMVFLESGRELPLEPIRIEDDGGTITAFRGEFVIDGSDRYQVELVAENGLRNPNPGTYPISALQDYAPVGRWLLPEDDTLTLLPDALLCLRVHARDDFGLTGVELKIEHGEAAPMQRALLPDAARVPEGRPAGTPVRSALVTEVLDLKTLLGEGGTAAGGLFANVALTDNKQPNSGTADLPRRIVQIVDAPQLAAEIGKSFRRLREEVTQARDIQQDRLGMLNTLLEQPAAEETTRSAFETSRMLTGIEVGQGRISAAMQRTHRGLMRSFDLHLWNRLEPSQHAATVVQLYREHSARMTEPLALDPAFYRDIAERRKAGTLGAMETALDPVLEMIDLVDRLNQNALPQVQRLLAEAQVAADDASREPLLSQVAERQQRIAKTLEDLLSRLEEWNEYQDLIQEVRALRDRQRDLESRTQEARGK